MPKNYWATALRVGYWRGNQKIGKLGASQREARAFLRSSFDAGALADDMDISG